MANHELDCYIEEMRGVRHECYVSNLLSQVADLLAEGEPRLRTELIGHLLADAEGELNDLLEENNIGRITYRSKVRCLSMTLRQAALISLMADNLREGKQLELF